MRVVWPNKFLLHTAATVTMTATVAGWETICAWVPRAHARSPGPVAGARDQTNKKLFDKCAKRIMLTVDYLPTNNIKRPVHMAAFSCCLCARGTRMQTFVRTSARRARASI